MGTEDFDKYWTEQQEKFTYGPCFGVGVEVDNFLDILIRYQRNSSYFTNDYNIQNQSLQLSVMYTLFNREIFEED